MNNQQPDSDPKKTQYRSFALTLWNESSAAGEWRCVLHDSQTQQRMGFASFEAMVEFLQKQLVDAEGESS